MIRWLSPRGKIPERNTRSSSAFRNSCSVEHAAGAVKRSCHFDCTWASAVLVVSHQSDMTLRKTTHVGRSPAPARRCRRTSPAGPSRSWVECLLMLAPRYYTPDPWSAQSFWAVRRQVAYDVGQGTDHGQDCEHAAGARGGHGTACTLTDDFHAHASVKMEGLQQATDRALQLLRARHHASATALAFGRASPTRRRSNSSLLFQLAGRSEERACLGRSGRSISALRRTDRERTQRRWRRATTRFRRPGEFAGLDPWPWRPERTAPPGCALRTRDGLL